MKKLYIFKKKLPWLQRAIDVYSQTICSLGDSENDYLNTIWDRWKKNDIYKNIKPIKIYHYCNGPTMATTNKLLIRSSTNDKYERKLWKNEIDKHMKYIYIYKDLPSNVLNIFTNKHTNILALYIWSVNYVISNINI